MRLLLPLFVCTAMQAQAQSLVHDQPQLRSVLLEEFTAINCGNCPAGHALAADLVADHPDRVHVVAVHGGGLAIPGAGQPDLRSSCGTPLWQQFAVTYQPSAVINRSPANGQLVTGLSGWAGAVNAVLASPAPVNIGMASSFDAGTRLLTVTVELLYTADGQGAEDRLTVVLTEDPITGYQQDYQNGAHPNYDHRHVLRDCITALWGDVVPVTTAGTFVQRTYTFTVPADRDIAACAVVGFVSEAQGEVHQVRSVAADGGSTTGVADRGPASAAPPYPVPADAELTIPLSPDERQGVVRVWDRTGRPLQVLPCGAGPVQVDVRSLQPGLYTFTVEGLHGPRTGRFAVAR